MAGTLTIGDFAKATHLTVKALHHYHRIGLLVPAHVDRASGYRHYTTGQIDTGHVIRRFRDLDMPLDEIAAVVGTDDLEARNRVIAAHLDRLETSLDTTRRAVESLRDLLTTPVAAPIEFRSLPSIVAGTISDDVGVGELGSWLWGAVGELAATATAQHRRITGAPGGLYATELFTTDRGHAVIYLPTDVAVDPVGRVRPAVLPATEVAVAVHHGSHDNIDRTYGALATYVAEHAIALDGPIRERYVAGPLDGADAQWITEIAWPVFRPGPH